MPALQREFKGRVPDQLNRMFPNYDHWNRGIEKLFDAQALRIENYLRTLWNYSGHMHRFSFLAGIPDNLTIADSHLMHFRGYGPARHSTSASRGLGFPLKPAVENLALDIRDHWGMAIHKIDHLNALHERLVAVVKALDENVAANFSIPIPREPWTSVRDFAIHIYGYLPRPGPIYGRDIPDLSKLDSGSFRNRYYHSILYNSKLLTAVSTVKMMIAWHESHATVYADIMRRFALLPRG